MAALEELLAPMKHTDAGFTVLTATLDEHLAALGDTELRNKRMTTMGDWWMKNIAWRVTRRAPLAARRIFTVIALLVLGAGPASAQLKPPGEVRWFVDATTNVIVNSTSFASVPIPPGHTAVLKSVVDAACSCASRMRGQWDGTTYTLPPSEQALTTDVGRLKAAARVDCTNG